MCIIMFIYSHTLDTDTMETSRLLKVSDGFKAPTSTLCCPYGRLSSWRRLWVSVTNLIRTNQFLVSLVLRVDPDGVPPRADVADHGGGVPEGDAGGGDAGGGRGSHHLPLPGPAAGVALQLPVGAAEPEEGGTDGGQRHQLHCPQDWRAAAQTGTAHVISVWITESPHHTGPGFMMVGIQTQQDF